VCVRVRARGNGFSFERRSTQGAGLTFDKNIYEVFNLWSKK